MQTQPMSVLVLPIMQPGCMYKYGAKVNSSAVQLTHATSTVHYCSAQPQLS